MKTTSSHPDKDNPRGAVAPSADKATTRPEKGASGKEGERWLRSPTDATGRKRAEEALKESEERFRITFEDAPVGVALVDLDGQRTRVNRALCEMLGCSEEELLSTPYLEHVHPDDREMSTEYFEWVLEEGAGSYELERRYLHADGHVVWNLTSVSLIRDSQGNPSYFVCLHQDITERKQAEERARFQAKLLDAVGQAVIATDVQEKVVYWNRAAEEVYGWSAEEAIGQPLVDLTVSEERSEEAAALMTQLRRGSSYSGEFIVRHKDGTIFSVFGTATPKYDEQGTLIGMIGVSSDITERKREEEALKASEERFRLLAENAQDIIFRYRLSPTPGFEYISPSATKVVGYTPQEHYANPDLLLRMVYPDDRHVIERFMEPSQAVGGSLSAMRIRRKDGREIWCESRHKNIYDSEGNPVAIEGIVRDVTERKRAEEALRESDRYLRTVVGNAPVVLFATDQKGVYTLHEGKGLEALGGRLNEVVGRSVFEVFQDVPEITEYVRRSLGGEEVVGTVEFRGRTFETSYMPLWDTGGRWLA